jgi:hypothetical protein
LTCISGLFHNKDLGCFHRDLGCFKKNCFPLLEGLASF